MPPPLIEVTYFIAPSTIPEKLLALKPQLHKSGLLLLTEKNIFLSGESKEMAEKAVHNIEKQNIPKKSTVKKHKRGQQMSIESAFANAVRSPLDTAPNWISYTL